MIRMDLEAMFSLIEDNARRTWNPLGVEEKQCSQWAEGLNLPEKGDYLLYTGCLYQMVPDIEAFSGILKKLESTGRAVFKLSISLTKTLRGIGIDLTKLYTSITVPKSQRERYSMLLRRILSALRAVGVNPAYMKEEPYNGVLYYDLGLDYLFEAHSKRLAKKIKESDAKKVITVDPHSTYALKHLLPNYVDDWDIEVVHYLDLLLEKGYEPKKGEIKEVVLHDPCYLARWVDVIDQPRKMLELAGIDVKEPDFSKEFTGCCGGPIESLFPSLASIIAAKRLRELVDTGVRDVVVMCPICLINLTREPEAGARVHDIAELVLR